MSRLKWLAGAALALAVGCGAQAVAAPAAGRFDAAVFAQAKRLQPKVIAWRRDIHEHPELGNREVRTAKLMADHLRALGLEVRTGVGVTGVVGVLKGGKSGGVVALRADMDALPVAEQTGLAFASKVTAEYNGQTVSVMHACGHDAHVAILMGAAEALAAMRKDIPGTIVFIFQPAEEGPPVGEEGGAALMIKEGVLKTPAPSAIFGLHVWPGEAGSLTWRPGPFMAASDSFQITLHGKQTHASAPWAGVDIASTAADVITAFNQIAARQINVTRTPTVLTVATIHGGVRANIIPDDMVLTGTMRSFDPALRKDALAKVERAVASIAERYGATGKIVWRGNGVVTSNDPALVAHTTVSLSHAAAGKVNGQSDYVTASEDFSRYQLEIPGFFYFLGIGPSPGANHSPFFNVMDEAALEVGVRAQALTALDYLQSLKR